VRKYVEAHTLLMTYKFPSRQQVAILEESIETCRLLYNHSLEERLKDKILWTKKEISTKTVTLTRCDMESWESIPEL
jgi:hypothetical protein